MSAWQFVQANAFLTSGDGEFLPSRIFRHSICSVAARTNRRDFLLLIPIMKGLAVAVEMTFAHLDMGTGGCLRLLFRPPGSDCPGGHYQHSNRTRHARADIEDRVHRSLHARRLDSHPIHLV